MAPPAIATKAQPGSPKAKQRRATAAFRSQPPAGEGPSQSGPGQVDQRSTPRPDCMQPLACLHVQGAAARADIPRRHLRVLWGVQRRRSGLGGSTHLRPSRSACALLAARTTGPLSSAATRAADRAVPSDIRREHITESTFQGSL